jgi:hypothetical protein
MRKTRKEEATSARLPPQREVVRDVMLSAAACDTWLTLLQLSRLTHYGEASISAQLRHLRKPEYGGYAVEKRPREVSKVLRGDDFGTVWEYQLKRAVSWRLADAQLRRGTRQVSRHSVAC